jgi:rhodanese-related sulfurtransferase
MSQKNAPGFCIMKKKTAGDKMRKTYFNLIIIIIAAALVLSACSGGPAASQTPAQTGSAQTSTVIQTPAASQSASASQTPHKSGISPEDAKAMIGTEGVVLVDVRSEEEYNAGYIPGAILLPVDQIAAQAATVLPDKSAKVIVYCRSGRRSADAANQLVQLGYMQVYDLGGIQSWPYEVVTK